jgi:2-polyprenyl-3-methyl-5-hydroxy-6-metoxy-1,4-benzoquinol methylase
MHTAARVHGRVLDVGCGEGLLVERLSAVSQHVTGLDQDEAAIRRANGRLAMLDNVTLETADFLSMKADPHAYDLVTFVASIHHMDLTRALRRGRDLLRPRGELVVVGLSANRSVADYVISALTLPAIRILSRLHHEERHLDLVAIPPKESLREIRTIAHRELPGSRLRRGFYYRYILQWRKPDQAEAPSGSTVD